MRLRILLGATIYVFALHRYRGYSVVRQSVDRKIVAHGPRLRIQSLDSAPGTDPGYSPRSPRAKGEAGARGVDGRAPARGHRLLGRGMINLGNPKPNGR